MTDKDREDWEADCLSVILPAHNEAAWIGRCLEALLAQDAAAGRLQIIVSANACNDGTEAVVEGFAPRVLARDWELLCLSSNEPGKVGALNRGEAVARGASRVFLDADVVCDPALLGQIRAALAQPQPTYATGTLAVSRAESRVTRAYANFWTRLPFVKGGAVGAGFFAVNAQGRARWGAFPEIISDDTYVRMNFAPHERHQVPACYYWPMVEGWRNLVRVRRRQDAGVNEVYRLYPNLRANEGKYRLGRSELAQLFMAAPISFLVYALVAAMVRLRRPSASDWSRGR